MDKEHIIKLLRSQGNPKNVEGMERFGIRSHNMLGISIPYLRKLAKQIGKNHSLSQELWKTGIHEARLVASFIDDPLKVTEKQMEEWVADFDSWDICDQVCGNLFDKTPFAYLKAKLWCEREEEYVRRAGFVMMAELAVHDKDADNNVFISFFPLIVKYARDERNFVKKAVNWALRQIGKRNSELRKEALHYAHIIRELDSPSARWIARDAIAELQRQ